MLQYDYLIIGGGMTAAAALHGIRQQDPDGSIGLISAETDPPYQRPPLTKKLWQGEPLESIWLTLPADGVTLHLGRTAQTLDVAARRVRDDQGRVVAYGTLLLATGGTPRRLPLATTASSTSAPWPTTAACAPPQAGASGRWSSAAASSAPKSLPPWR